jgi:hypothetical protein
MPIASRQAAEARYAGYRAAASQKAEKLLQPIVAPVRIAVRAMTPDALHMFDLQWRHQPARPYYGPWRDMASD